jgi:hypothetical protein
MSEEYKSKYENVELEWDAPEYEDYLLPEHDTSGLDEDTVKMLQSSSLPFGAVNATNVSPTEMTGDVGSYDSQIFIDGANNEHLVELRFQTNNNNIVWVYYRKKDNSGRVVDERSITFGNGQVGTMDYWKLDTCRATVDKTNFILRLSGHQIYQGTPFRGQGTGRVTYIIPNVWTPVAGAAGGVTITIPQTPHFTDVPTTNPFYSFVETLYATGAVSGYDIGNGQQEFRPGASVTRSQLAKILVQFMKFLGMIRN